MAVSREPVDPAYANALAARNLLVSGADAVTAVVRLIPDHAWENRSPCADWTAYGVLDHLTSEHLWAPRLLRGDTIEQVGDRYEHGVLGLQPMREWEKAIARSLAAWGAADLNGFVWTGGGKLPTTEYVNQMLLDLVVHAWDLAKATGVEVDFLRIDRGAIGRATAYEKPRIQAGETASVFAAPVVTASKDPLDRLVALVGRDPAWQH